MASVAPARRAAFAALLAVERGTAHSDDALHAPAMAALERRDRDLATELTLGALRWELVLDDEIAARLRDPRAEMHLGVIVALRMGMYQLLFLDRVPAHAAIGESVELAKESDGAGAAALTNAVLRRAAREGARGRHFAPEDAHPAWLVARWRHAYGAEAATRMCAFDQAPAPATLRVLGAEMPGAVPGEFLACARRVAGGDMQALCAAPGVRAQDEASQLVGELAGMYAAEAEGRGMTRVLDACAAPGGKTAILLERTVHARVTALELSPQRLRALRTRLGGPERLTLEHGDARQMAGAWDVVLADVPCSGTGTLARNPELRTRLRESVLATQAARQREILRAALAALEPGGVLVYSTCSLEPEENEAVVEAELRDRDGYEMAPAAEALRQLAARGVVTAEGLERLLATALRGPYLRTLPGVHPCDGFFAAIVRRRG